MMNSQARYRFASFTLAAIMLAWTVGCNNSTNQIDSPVNSPVQQFQSDEPQEASMASNPAEEEDAASSRGFPQILDPELADASPLPVASQDTEIAIPEIERHEDDPETLIRLSDVTSQSGVTFEHTDGGGGEGYIVEGMASGIVLFDYDLDGLEDIYFLNGAPLKGTQTTTTARNALYRNNGDWTFTDVTDAAGVGDPGFALGGTAGDYDDDGDLDLYVTNFGPNVLLRNDGNGSFSDVTTAANVSGGDRVGAGCSFFDMDADGDLDLYAANYVDFRYENHVPIEMKGHRFQAGPQYYNPVPDSLFRNNGDGTFSDVSESSGIAAFSGPGMATLCWDFDTDGDEDVFVCNDGKPNFLFLNDGKGHFTESAVLAGLAYDFNGTANSNMGVDCADYDGDGHLDLFTTDYQAELPILYRNLGNGLYEDVSTSAKIDDDLYAHVHWGTGFADFDNDTDRDLFVACGHFDPIELIDDRTAKKVRNYLLMNLGDGTFADVSQQCGDGMEVIASSRGAGFDDLDNDGDVDAVVLNSDSQPTVLRNDSQTEHHWLQVRLRCPESNHFAIGAQARVIMGEHSQLGISVSGRGYQSYFGTRLHFGLGFHESVDKVEVRWPDGTVESFQVDSVDQLIELTKGTSQPKA